MRIRLHFAIFTLLVLTGSLAAAFAQEQSPSEDSSAAAVRKVLDDQVAAWNHGDLRGYMQGYWNSPDLTFFSGARVTKGWEATLQRYINGYQSGGREMGQLDFQDLEIQVLSPEATFVRGKFHLTMKDGKEPTGLFTLLLKKFPEGWRIVHDHSCGE